MKKKTKPSIKKSDHKHIYEVIDIDESILWFNKREVCKVCGRIGNEFRDLS